MYKSACRPHLILIAWLVTIVSACATLDIPSLTWTQRSDWINVKTDVSPTAVGDGVADDTAAIQAALDLASTSGSKKKTVYLPSGQYKITSTLYWNSSSTFYGVTGASLVGCGKDTVIQWYGETGGTMFWPRGGTRCRYNGITWDGLGTAGIGCYHHSINVVYESRIFHDNEAFRNFTRSGIESYGGNGNGTAPAPTAETQVTNCLFQNCATGIYNGSVLPNSYQWIVDGCEFITCGKGINAPYGKTIILDTHFEGSTVVDITHRAGVTQRVRRCSSNQSKAFFITVAGSSATADIIQDCRINHWTDTNGAIQMGDRGPSLIFDCVFTNPPNSNPPIKLTNSGVPYRLTVSNNSCPTLTTLVNSGTNSETVVQTIPPGSFGGNLYSATQHFLKTSVPADSVNILDVKSAPYNAQGNGSTDDTAAIQSAINDAITANNGSIVYIPVGTYKITQTLQANGANFTIQGCGFRSSVLNWAGATGGVVISAVTPQNVLLQEIEFSCDPSVACVVQTGNGNSSSTYDGVFYTLNGNANSDGRGIELVNLPAGANVYLKQINAPLTVNDCGAADIFGKFVMGGKLIVQGALNPKTGFLGFLVFQGGTLTNNSSYWDMYITDNQSIVMGDLYNEQSYNHLLLERGNGTDAGEVTIQGFKQQANALRPTISVNNYQGRLLYGPQGFGSATGTTITQTGSNLCDIILLNDTFATQPSISLDTGANLILTQCLYGAAPSFTYMADVMPADGLDSIAAAFDHLRLLGYEDMMHRYVENAVTNSTFESDTANSTPRSTLGNAPASWTLSTPYSNSGLVRQATVAANGSPFTSGSQGLLLIDNTSSSSGSRLQANPAIAPLTIDQPAVFAFDFKLNSTTPNPNTDVWARVFAGSQTQCSLRLRCLGTSASLGASVSGTLTTLTTLQRDTWYAVEAIIPAPSSAVPATVKVVLTPYGSSASSIYYITGATVTGTTGMNNIQFGQSVTGQNNDVSLDNIELKTDDPLLGQ